MIANLPLYADIFHLYFDHNKAFNSVLHNAPWKILSNGDTLNYLIKLIKNLCAAVYDYPIVNGFAFFAAHCIRDFRSPCFPFTLTCSLIQLYFTSQLYCLHNAVFPFT